MGLNPPCPYQRGHLDTDRVTGRVPHEGGSEPQEAGDSTWDRPCLTASEETSPADTVIMWPGNGFVAWPLQGLGRPQGPSLQEEPILAQVGL